MRACGILVVKAKLRGEAVGGGRVQCRRQSPKLTTDEMGRHRMMGPSEGGG